MVLFGNVIMGRAGRLPTAFVLTGAIAAAVLAASGSVYRVLTWRLSAATGQPVRLPVPLESVPARIESWAGTDVPLGEVVQDVAGMDDWLNRLYVGQDKNKWANVYVGYSARPRTLIGHRPDICYVNSGWILDSATLGEFTTPEGRRVPCKLHRFHRPVADAGEVFVLSFYVINGRFASDERQFMGLGWRTPNIQGDRARYVAHVQISSAVESSVWELSSDITEVIMGFLPDEQGRVRAVDGAGPSVSAAR